MFHLVVPFLDIAILEAVAANRNEFYFITIYSPMARALKVSPAQVTSTTLVGMAG